MESFEDGVLGSDWLGDTSAFFINSDNWLQSNGPTSLTSIYISKPVGFPVKEWQLKAMLPFNPSSTNYARVYLSADRPDLKSPDLNGYFIKLGGETGSTDAIELFKQEGKVITKLIRGKDGQLGNTSNSIGIKVIYADHTWKILVDSSLTGNFTEEGQFTEETILKSPSYFGIICFYTATRSDKFFFDDIIINAAPIAALQTLAINPYKINILLNQSLNNYTIDYGEINGIKIQGYQFIVNDSIISIQLDAPLPYGNHSGVIYATSDSRQTIQIPFLLHFKRPVLYGDIVINEIYPDPSPSIGLPEYEYIELYNNTSDTINLKGFKLTDLSTSTILPEYKIAPYSYVLLTNEQGVSEFNIPNKIGLSNWPSLNNTSDELSLINEKGALIFKVEYTIIWHPPSKRDGGYSFEMINPQYYCDQHNWKTSIAVLGGTPGLINSVYDPTPDIQGPEITNWEIDSTQLYLFFDEYPDSTNISDASAILISQDETISLKLISVYQNQLVYSLADNIAESKNYQLHISSIFDCKRNKSKDTSIAIVFPSKETKGQIVINEILFNPLPYKFDFVEIYNTSNYYFDLKDWKISNGKSAQVISSRRLIIPPKGYMAFTPDKASLLNTYNCEEKNIIQNPLPAFNDDSGTVIIINPEGVIRDKFSYNENYHFSILRDVEGVSLERINPDSPTDNPNNWHSCAETAGFATPGKENSQLINGSLNDNFFVEPPIISPNQDGDKDFAYINLNYDKPGLLANIFIFDWEGRMVKNLVSNQSIPSQTFFQWDGTDDKQNLVREGYYLVYAEIFDLNGFSEKHKQSIVVHID
ncbi:MAG TPA: lamin tail domain-containing protein [Cytophagaceae bacterium]